MRKEICEWLVVPLWAYRFILSAELSVVSKVRNGSRSRQHPGLHIHENMGMIDNLSVRTHKKNESFFPNALKNDSTEDDTGSRLWHSGWSGSIVIVLHLF